MAQKIYNEGRIVGLSAWEIFAKASEAAGVPESAIPTESQWLTAMIGAGASMILRVPAGTQKGVHDFELPDGSNLTASGVIIANPFMGDCEWDSATWAKKINSYSPLALNNSTYSPPDVNNEIPADSNYNNAIYKNCVAEFAKITDGIVFTKNATWISTPADIQKSDDGSPDKDIDPNFNSSTTVVRLYVDSDITYDVAVLLTGFQNKRILQGLSLFASEDSGYSVGGSTDITKNDWANGGMIGPEVIPCASKIVFTIPNSAYNLANSLDRTIPSSPSYTIPSGGVNIDGIKIKENSIGGTIKANSILDFNAIDLLDYYTAHNLTSSSTLQEDVSNVALGIGDSTNTLTAWYPGMTASKVDEEIQRATPSNLNFFPPALYASQITESGSPRLIPIDVSAPGTVKGFESESQALAYKTLLPNNYAIYHNPDNDTFSFVTLNSETWSGTAKLEYVDDRAPRANLTVGNTEAQFVALTYIDPVDGVVEYNTSGSSGTVDASADNNLSWDNMLTALTQGRKVDILGTRVHNLVNDLKSNNKIGIANNDTIAEVGATKFVVGVGSSQVEITRSDNLARVASGKSVKLGTQYIEFESGIRLFISKNAPTSGMKPGDIGIGW